MIRWEVVSLPGQGSEFVLYGGKGGLVVNPMSVFDEEMGYWDVSPLAAGEEVLQEKVATWAAKSTLPSLDSPEVIVKGPPVLLVQLLLWLAQTRCPEEDKVAKQISREQRFATGVECLENNLGGRRRFPGQL